jgi:hypothetical protein
MARMQIPGQTYLTGVIGQVRLRLEWLGRAALSASQSLDADALLMVLLALAAGLIVFLSTPANPARLNHFVAEHVLIFDMVDSTPLRRGYLVFFAALLIGAVVLALRAATPRAVTLQSWHYRVLGTLIAIGLALNLVALIRNAMVGRISALLIGILFFLNAGAVASACLPQRFARVLVPTVIVLLVGLALLPATTGVMRSVSLPLWPWVDFHLSTLLSGGDMLLHGYRLFSDVPTGYSIIMPALLAAAAKAGAVADLGWLFRLTEVFQVLTLGLFMLAAWQRSQGHGLSGRMVALLLMALVVTPFLSTASISLLFPNMSGLRFVMFPVAVLVLGATRSLSLALASAVFGALVMLALLYNMETGVAIFFGLGIAWLLRASQSVRAQIYQGLAGGLLAAIGVAGLSGVLHRAALGVWPLLDLAETTALMRQFGSGFGGLSPPFRIVPILIFAHAGTLLVRALAQVLGRRAAGVNAGSAGIAGMLLAWAPYYANRPTDGNLWSFLGLYVLLVIPGMLAGPERASRWALLAMLLLVPIPLAEARNNLLNLQSAEAMQVAPDCGAGLALPPEACTELGERVAELRRLAAPGDVLWITAYPFLTMRQSRLRPLIAPLDLFGAALTEADLSTLAGRIASRQPLALLLDGNNKSPLNQSIPEPMRSLHARLATEAGYRVCPLLSLTEWQVWLQPTNCTPATPALLELRERYAPILVPGINAE